MRLFSLILLAFLFSAVSLPAQDLRIIHINVGQGDATLILGPVDPGSGERVSVLIDAGDITNGGDPDGGSLVGAVLEDNGVTELDYFVLTHYDSDHLGGWSIPGRQWRRGPARSARAIRAASAVASFGVKLSITITLFATSK